MSGYGPVRIITTEANELVANVHDRMPVILGPDDYAPWLGEEPANDNQLKAMLRPYPSERITMWPVDRCVGNVKNEGPELAQPIAPQLGDICLSAAVVPVFIVAVRARR